MIIVDIILGILIGVGIGVPVSIYAGLVSSRLLNFHELKTEAYMAVSFLNTYISSEEDLSMMKAKMADLVRISISLSAHGHTEAEKYIEAVLIVLENDISEVDSSWAWAMARHKSDPRRNIASSAITNSLFKIKLMKPDWGAVLQPWNVFK